MVTTTASSFEARYSVAPQDYDGVVRVFHGGYTATGVLLHEGRAVLTAAHLFTAAPHSAPTRVLFKTAYGETDLYAQRVSIHPYYKPYLYDNDLALVWLSAPAPVEADRYTLYRRSDELGQVFTMVGYGQTGSGWTGALPGTPTGNQRLKALNRFDADDLVVSQALRAIWGLTYDPRATTPGTQLYADFDSGSPLHDAAGRLLHLHDLGLGIEEGMIAPGDSGGPAFIEGRIAGVASYNTNLSLSNVVSDIDDTLNASFGEVGGWQRVSAHQQWIDQSLRAHYPDAPSRPQDVQKWVPEGDHGTRYAYFLVQFTGVRSTPDQIVSVDYATRDGTAIAGEDYIATSGTLNLYPGENQAVIPVEIIGDKRPEPNESLYLDIFNPVGGSFGPGVAKLTAVRTIVDDDLGWWL